MKYSLSAFYQDFVKEKILKDFLKIGQIPTENQINTALAESQIASQGFRAPMLSAVDTFITNGEFSSASKVNTMFSSAESDLNICISAVIDQEDKVASLYDTTFSKLSGLQNKANQMKQQVDTLLFSSKNTDTHEELFYEKFNSLEMVDTKNTTAFVDINTNEAILKATEQYPIDMSKYLDTININVESNPKIINNVDVGEMKVQNIVSSNNKVWLHQVSSTDPLSSVYIDLILRISSSGTDVNKIVLEPYSIDLKTQVNIELAYSEDGLNWKFVDGESKKRLDKITSLSFKGIKSEYWRIRFTKFGNDGFFSSFYAYNFGLKSLTFFGKTYDKVSRLDLGYLYSKPILFKNNIKMATVKVCDSLPSGASIKYGLAPIYESELGDIVAGTKLPTDLYFYPLDVKDKPSVLIDFLSTTEQAPINGLLVDQTITYKDKAIYDFCLGTLFPNNYAKSQTTILRNGLDQSAHNQLGEESPNLKGWNFDGNYYSTYVLIEDYNGVEIDLGSTEMYINNSQVQGRVSIKQGLNFIVTHRDNWRSLNLVDLPLESDQIIDPLYPYNHKYLIEGLNPSLYGRDLSTVIDGKALVDIIDNKGIYKKTARTCWALRMKELQSDVFIARSKNELDVFCYKIDNTNQERIVVKSDPDNGLINNESFSIITKLHSAENIKGLIFKAVLETTDNKVSPVLTEYLVKIK